MTLRILICMENSGTFRRAFQAQGHFVVSVDWLPSTDDADELHPNGGHLMYTEVFDVVEKFPLDFFDFAIFHPTCTLHTVAAAWAFKDPDFERYPGVGYHQKVAEGTLTGEARRIARDTAEAELERIRFLPIKKIIENPRGTIPTRTSYGPPIQVLQPYEHGDDASKATCIWAFDENGDPMPQLAIPVDPSLRVKGRMVEWPKGSGKLKERWANQTDSGQNNLTPGEDRWAERSKTYPGIARAGAQHWGNPATWHINSTGSSRRHPVRAVG